VSEVVVVSPHLDDAVLSAWLVLSGAPGTAVVTCFAGTPDPSVRGDWDARTGYGSAAEAVAARRAEDEAALRRCAGRPVHLDLLDEQYRLGAAVPREDLVARLRTALAGAGQVWLPAGLGAHVDHLATREAGLAAVRPGQAVHLYADLPYGGQPGWPPRVSRSARDLAVQALLATLRRDTPAGHWSRTLAGAGVATGPARVRALSRSEYRAKVDAVRRYRSQLAELRCGPRHPLRERRLFAREVSWPVLDGRG
jgi:LmbE family N-acetylglucosaminyl deacetylase